MIRKDVHARVQDAVLTYIEHLKQFYDIVALRYTISVAMPKYFKITLPYEDRKIGFNNSARQFGLHIYKVERSKQKGIVLFGKVFPHIISHNTPKQKIQQ